MTDGNTNDKRIRKQDLVDDEEETSGRQAKMVQLRSHDLALAAIGAGAIGTGTIPAAICAAAAASCFWRAMNHVSTLRTSTSLLHGNEPLGIA